MQVCYRLLGGNRLRRHHRANGYRRVRRWRSWGVAGNVPMPGTWNWPPYAEGGNMPRTTSGYVRVNPYPYNPHSRGRWVHQCR
jgi:hypothetical protein